MADLTYTTPDDTDVNELDAIQPFVQGEDANANTFNRPGENLRLRTERSRIAANVNSYLSENPFSGYLLDSGSVTVQWDGEYDGTPSAPAVGSAGSGAFTVNGDITLLPLIGTGTLRDADEKIYGPGGTPSIKAWTDVVMGASNLRVVSDLYAHDGGDWVEFEVVVATVNLVTPTVEVFGVAPVDGEHGFGPGKLHVRVTISNGDTDTTEVQHVISAVAADPDAQNIMTVWPHPTLAYTAADPAAAVTKTGLTRGLNNQIIVITSAALDAVWTRGDDVRMQEGDVLAIAFDDARARRGFIPEAGSSEVVAASIVNLTEEPEKAPYAIPLCRAQSGRLHFAHGVIIEEYDAAQVTPRLKGGDASTIATPAVTKTTIALSQLSVEGQLNELATYVEDIYDGTFPVSTLTVNSLLASDRIGINQDPPDASTRLHITEEADDPAIVRLERKETAMSDGDIYAEVHAYGRDLGGTGVRAAVQFAASGADGEADVVLRASGAGATLAEQLRVSSTAVTVAGTLEVDAVRASVAAKIEILDPVEVTGLVDVFGVVQTDSGFTAPGTSIDLKLGHSGGLIEFADTREALPNDNVMGQVAFSSLDTGNAGVRALVEARSVGTDALAELLFYTRGAVGPGDGTERMRVTYDGAVCIGIGNSSGGTEKLRVWADAGVGTAAPDLATFITAEISNAAVKEGGVEERVSFADSQVPAGLTIGSRNTIFHDATFGDAITAVTFNLLNTAGLVEAMRVVGDGSMRLGNALTGIDVDDVPMHASIQSFGKMSAAFVRDDPPTTGTWGTTIVLGNMGETLSHNRRSSVLFAGQQNGTGGDGADFVLGRLTASRESGADTRNTKMMLYVNDGTGADADVEYQFPSTGNFVANNAPVAMGTFVCDGVSYPSGAAPAAGNTYGITGTPAHITSAGTYEITLAASLSDAGANAVVQVTNLTTDVDLSIVCAQIVDADTIIVNFQTGADGTGAPDDQTFSIVVWDLVL